jgi:protoheme IX farnesyltransferase
MAAMALLAIAIGAGASGALNMSYDSDIDVQMKRTMGRPVPRGAILPGEALGFGLTLAVGSVLSLYLFANPVAAAILAFTIFFYAVIYTMWLKRTTPQNIVIGGAAGAFPPMIGWAAVTGSVDLGSIALFLIIFMWTPPHFWALALLGKDEYARAGVPMLPVVAGAAETRRQIFIYTVLVVPISFLPALLGFAGPLFVAGVAVLGAAFIWYAWKVLRSAEGEAERRACRRMFSFSIAWLFGVFALILVERMAGLPAFHPILG